MEKVKASLSVRNWSAQYMQEPTSEEGAILKRDWWIPFHGPMPHLKHVIQSYDTAFSAKQTADYSAITTWGVFQQNESEHNSIMLLDAVRGKLEFPGIKSFSIRTIQILGTGDRGYRSKGLGPATNLSSLEEWVYL